MTAPTQSPEAARTALAPQGDVSPSALRGRQRGDGVFAGLSRGAGILILVILAAVASFLLVQAAPAIAGSDLPYGNTWAYALPFAFGTLWSSALALAFAVPVSIGIALFISHYAPRKMASFIGYVMDLLAAVPSVVFGLWGIYTLAPALLPVFEWLNANLGGLPVLGWFFGGTVSGTGRTILTAALVLAIMVLPIITSISREVFISTPRLHEEASLALGATKWEMIRQAVLPFGRSGIVSACMLGLGRALGETMAVTFVIGNAHRISPSLYEAGNSIASTLANEFAEAASDLHVSSLIALGLILFFVTFVVLALSKILLMRLGRSEGEKT